MEHLNSIKLSVKSMKVVTTRMLMLTKFIISSILKFKVSKLLIIHETMLLTLILVVKFTRTLLKINITLKDISNFLVNSRVITRVFKIKMVIRTITND